MHGLEFEVQSMYLQCGTPKVAYFGSFCSLVFAVIVKGSETCLITRTVTKSDFLTGSIVFVSIAKKKQTDIKEHHKKQVLKKNWLPKYISQQKCMLNI